jgi:hypothetical protein
LLERENPPGKVAPGGKVFSQATLFTEEAVPHPVLEEIGKLDLMNMTPVEALNALHALQKKLELKAAPAAAEARR